MHIESVGTVDLATGVEQIHALPKVMSHSEAEEYCLEAFRKCRFWFCRPPTYRDGYMHVYYDYYIIMLSKTEQLGLRSLFSGCAIAGYTRQSLRGKGLLDEFDNLTTSGDFVARMVLKYSYI